MSTELVTQDIWPQLTRAARNCRRPCAVAVAYFGAGASHLLPLPKGSVLVVDASELAVASGQTCPLDLLGLVRRGIRAYSVPNLHAKVFVVGRSAYVGSANVSNRSSTQLVEALVRSSELAVVRSAKKFVQDLCLHELTPNVLEQLAKLYRPPQTPGGGRSNTSTKDTSRRPTLPRLLLAQLKLETWSERDQAAHDTAVAVAKKRRTHPRSFRLDTFRHTGDCPYRCGDVVIQVTDEGNGRVLVTPPSTVLHVRTGRSGNRQVSFVCLERPDRRRKQVDVVARAMGHNSLKRLRRNGVVRNTAFAQALLGAWAG